MEAVGNDDIDVTYFHTLKPLDVELARAQAKKVKNIICVEEASIAGGFGSAVSEAISDIPGVTIRRLGIPDKFQTAYGSFEEISRDVGIDTVGIRAEIDKALKGQLAHA